MSTYKRKRYEPYKLYIPENLDIDGILVENPPVFNRLPKNYVNYRDKCVYILHLINSIPNSQNDFDYEGNYGFTPIKKEYLRNRVHEYRAYINYLIERGIVIENVDYH